MTHYLITGGAGFIGSTLADKLLAAGHEVTVVDDLSTGSIRNLDTARQQPKFRHHIDTIMNVPLMAELVDRADVVVHLAAAVGVRLIVEKPVHTIETNIRGTEIVLELAARKGRTVLITSSSEVYGKSAKVPYREDDDIVLGSTTRPRWGYACSKAIDEFLALAYWREHQLPVTVVRLFNTVGPRQVGRYGMVIPRFVAQGLAGEPITVYGDGSQSRAFADVDDVTNALISLLDSDDARGQVFNVGNDREISIRELAEIVRAQTGGRSELRFVPFEQAYDENFEDLVRRVPDLTKLRATIGQTPSRGPEEIVARVIAHMKANSAE